MKYDPREGKRDITYTEGFLNPYEPIRQHEHRLPHWQQGCVFYFVTWRLADSLPRDRIIEFVEERNLWLKNHPHPWNDQTRKDYALQFAEKIDDWLDAGEGTCVLGDPTLAHCVADALLHFNGKRYEMDSFVIMPNHVHVLFRSLGHYRLEHLIKSWKGYSAREINRHLRRSGTLWQEDYWDRILRNEEHLLSCRNYIRDNPKKARLNRSQLVLFDREMEGGFSNPPSTADRNVRPPR